jgi:transglutaminase-like putative cysteine protease
MGNPRLIEADWFVCVRLMLLVSVLAVPEFTQAACDLKIISAGPCFTNGTPGTPSVGDTYSLYVTFNVSGTPSNPFRLKFTLANATWYSGNITGQNGWTYGWQYSQTLDLDDAIPWSVTLDPDGVSGDINPVNNVTNGVFTPIPPAAEVELYSPRMMHGSETSIANFQAGSGVIPNLYVLFGEPSSHGAQSVITAPGPPNSQSLVTPPYGTPMFQVARTNVIATTFHDTNTFTVQLNCIRVNPTKLRKVTWAAMNSLTTNWTQWLAPTPTCESTNAAIINFVQQSLPTNYLTTMTPYDTARTLHRAVMKALTYGSAQHGDAVGVLQDGVANCTGFAALLTACLRNVGVPARVISGFFQGDSVWHDRVEFYLPGPSYEWLLADPTFGNGNDPTGTFAYYFGYVPDANNFLSVDVGELHVLPYWTCGAVQQSDIWWNGGTYNSSSTTSYLQPNGVLCMTNSAKGSFQFWLSDAPTEGSVVILTSTNLTAWAPVVTNSASGSAINYSFPNTNGLHRFYRVNVIP